jgi:hypothetical protein
MEFDDQIRAEVNATRPDRAPAIDHIGARANRLRRHTRVRFVGAVAAFVLCGVGVANALPSGGGTPSTLKVETTSPDGHGRKPAPVSTPRTTVLPRDGQPTPGTDPGAPITQTTVGAVPSIPGATTPTAVATAPNGSAPPVTSPSITSPPTTPTQPTTPTTTVPNYPPVGAGHVRLLIVLDNTGLHAPATFAVSGDQNVEVLFDNRIDGKFECLSSKQVSGTPGFLYACPWSPERTAIAGVTFHTGTLELYLVGGSGTPNPARTTITFTKG